MSFNGSRSMDLDLPTRVYTLMYTLRVLSSRDGSLLDLEYQYCTGERDHYEPKKLDTRRLFRYPIQVNGDARKSRTSLVQLGYPTLICMYSTYTVLLVDLLYHVPVHNTVLFNLGTCSTWSLPPVLY